MLGSFSAEVKVVQSEIQCHTQVSPCCRILNTVKWIQIHKVYFNKFTILIINVLDKSDHRKVQGDVVIPFNRVTVSVCLYVRPS